MALTLDATVGGANSNSYITAATATTLLEENPFATAWAALATATKEVNLVRATRIFDAEFDWVGYRTDLTTPQALEWPRSGVYIVDRGTVASNIIPVEIQRGVAEFANYLSLQTEQPETSAGIKRLTLPGGLGVDFRESGVQSTPEIPDYIRRWVAKFVTRATNMRSATISVGRA